MTEPTEAAEQQTVAAWLKARGDEGLRPEEMVIFVRSAEQLGRAERAAALAGLSFKRVEKQMEIIAGKLPVCTMHLAKGLEFRVVVVMACDESAIPDPTRLEQASDPAELEEVYNSERQLLYVACTRARDRLILSAAGTPSEFLLDL